ncbi:MAG: hypothetical protein ACYSWQ_18280 [Planctomycetota bacterium]|jgi:hypothetical protein
MAILGTICRLAWFVASSSRLLGVSLNESDHWRMLAPELKFGEFEQTDYRDLTLATHTKACERWTERRRLIMIELCVSQA